ncbi:MAG: outer membrane protein assembly factor BamB [bacterium]
MNRFSRIVLTGLSALALTGCGSMADPTTWFGDSGKAELEPAKLQSIVEQFKPFTQWSRDVGAMDQQPGLRPRIDGEALYVIDQDGELSVLDLQSGAVQGSWKTGITASGGPGSADGRIFVGTTEAELVSFDAVTGKEQWRANVSSEILAPPAVSQGIVVVHTNDGNLFGFNAEDGQQLWRYDRKVPVLTLRGSSAPVIVDDVVFCGLAGGKLVALSLQTGELDWEQNVSFPGGASDLERLTDIDGDPLVYSGTVFAATYRGEVAALGAVSGKEFWSRDMSSYTGMAVNWQLLYVSDDRGFLWALDPETGAAKWRQESLANRRLSAPAIHGDYVVVGDLEGYLHWMNTGDGRIVARSRVSRSPIVSPPQVRGDILYVLADDGELAAIGLPETP